MAWIEDFVRDLFNLSNTVYSGVLVNLLLAVVILLIGFVVARMAAKITERVLGEIELNRLLKNSTRIDVSAEQFITSTVRYLIYFFVIIMALNQIGLTTTILYIISSAIILILIVSFILALRDFIPNMFAGLSIQKKGFITKGDRIHFRDVEGTIEYLNLVETRIKTDKGDIISVPNALLAKHEIVKKKGTP